MLKYAETRLTTDDSVDLLVRRYTPRSGEAERTLFIVHGVCEYGGRYDHIARLAVKNGWNVVIPDLRGHGRSGGVPTHVGDFRRYVSDLDLVRKHFELEGHNTAILGHSMGGLVTIRFVQTYPQSVCAMVLMSPLLAVSVPIPKRTVAAGRVLSLVAPRTRFRSRVDPSFLTHSKEAVAKRLADPFVHKSVTAGWFFAMQSSLERAWEDAHKIHVPLLIMQAGDDHLVNPDAPEGWMQGVQSQDRQFLRLKDNLHELLNEVGWRDSAEHILSWLDDRVPSSSCYHIGSDHLQHQSIA